MTRAITLPSWLPRSNATREPAGNAVRPANDRRAAVADDDGLVDALRDVRHVERDLGAGRARRGASAISAPSAEFSGNHVRCRRSPGRRRIEAPAAGPSTSRSVWATIGSPTRAPGGSKTSHTGPVRQRFRSSPATSFAKRSYGHTPGATYASLGRPSIADRDRRIDPVDRHRAWRARPRAAPCRGRAPSGSSPDRPRADTRRR